VFVSRGKILTAGRHYPNCFRVTQNRKHGARYIIRIVFNVKKVNFVEKTNKVIHQGGMRKGKNRKNFEVYSALEFIAATT